MYGINPLEALYLPRSIDRFLASASAILALEYGRSRESKPSQVRRLHNASVKVSISGFEEHAYALCMMSPL